MTLRYLNAPLVALAVASMLGACAPAPSQTPGVFTPTRDGPEGAAPGTCWGRTVTPAVVERVRQRIEVEPAQVNPDGTIARAPVYRVEDRQVIVTPRQDTWFETPCAEVQSPEFIASLQRALIARGLLAGPPSGILDAATRSAIQRFQAPSGPDSPVLSLESARALGLIAVPRPADG